MQSLLRWGIENSSNSTVDNDAPRRQPQSLDPGVIDMILGRPDSELMKEALAIAVDETKDEDARLAALDHFEVLIENIDNAIDMEKLGMWSPIQQLLESSSSSIKIKTNVLWIIGTAVQNNPPAQNAYLSLPNSPIGTVLADLSPSESSSALRSKAVYALSGLLKHNTRAVKTLETSDGWETLKSALEDPDITVRRKVVFLLSTLLTPNQAVQSDESDSRIRSSIAASDSNAPMHPNSHASMTAESTATSPITAAALKAHKIVDLVVKTLVDPLPHGPDGDEERDEDYEEKAIRLVYVYLVSVGGDLQPDQKRELEMWAIRGAGELGDLEKEEKEQLIVALQK